MRGRPPASPRRAHTPQGQCRGPATARLRPQDLASGRRLPASRRSSQGGDKRLTSDAPQNSARHPPWGRPPATPTAPNAGSQERTLSDRCWVPTPTPPTPGKQGQRGLAARRKDGRLGEGRHLTPDAAHSGERSSPRGDLPPPPRRATPSRARTPKGQSRAPTPAQPLPQQVGSGPCLPAPRTGRHGGQPPNPRRPSQRREAPPRGRPPTTPTVPNAGSQERTLWGQCWGPTPTRPAPGKYRHRGLAARPKDGRPGGGERVTPDAPHSGARFLPQGATSRLACGAQHPAGHARQRTVPAPHACRHAPTARGQRTPTTRFRGGQPGEDKHLFSDAPRNGAGQPPAGTPSRHPNSAQRRRAKAHAVGPVLGPHAHTTRSREILATGPGCPPQGRVTGRERAPDTRRSSQP